jgi:hypothetical protein
MKTGLTAALIALFALSAPCVVIAADEGEQAGSVTDSTPATGQEEGDASSDSSDTKVQGSADDRGDTDTEGDSDDKTESDDKTKSGSMSVHRHRAGACPEGPPCPTD